MTKPMHIFTKLNETLGELSPVYFFSEENKAIMDKDFFLEPIAHQFFLVTVRKFFAWVDALDMRVPISEYMTNVIKNTLTNTSVKDPTTLVSDKRLVARLTSIGSIDVKTALDTDPWMIFVFLLVEKRLDVFNATRNLLGEQPGQTHGAM